MNDMRPAIEPKSDQINADDLIAGPMTVMITGVKVQGGVEQPVSISITGTSKVYRPCKSMSRVMVAAWGPDANVYVGRSMTLYRDPSITWAGLAVGGIRISHMSDIDRDMMLMLTATKQKRAPHKIGVLRKVAPVHPALIAAEAAAAKGVDAFRAWWQTNATARDAIRPDLARLQKIATDADAKLPEDPFGLPPADPMPTADELARAESEAMAAIAKMGDQE